MADDTPLFGNAPAVSPAALQARRQMAQELMKQGANAGPIRSPWQGVGRIVQSAMGGYEGYQADQAELQARQKGAANLAAALKGGDMGGAIGAMSDPFANPEAGKLLASVLTPQMVDQGGGVRARDRFGNAVGPFIPKTIMGNVEAGPGTKFPYPMRGTPEGGLNAVPINPGMGAQAAPGQAPVQPDQLTQDMNNATGWQTTQNGQNVGGGTFPTTPQGMMDMANRNAASRKGAETMAEEGTKARMVPIGEIMKETKTAPQALNALNIIEDTVKHEGPAMTTGPAAESVLKLRQTVNGLLGSNVMGDTSGPELIKKMNAQLASASLPAFTNRGTQFDLKVFMENNPGLNNSTQGTLFLTNILKQTHRQNLQLAQMAGDPKNWQNWPQVQQDFYQKNPIINPLTGTPLGVAADSKQQQGSGSSRADLEAEARRRKLPGYQ